MFNIQYPVLTKAPGRHAVDIDASARGYAIDIGITNLAQIRIPISSSPYIFSRHHFFPGLAFRSLFSTTA
jgi:hypothetical protein